MPVTAGPQGGLSEGDYPGGIYLGQSDLSAKDKYS